MDSQTNELRVAARATFRRRQLSSWLLDVEQTSVGGKADLPMYFQILASGEVRGANSGCSLNGMLSMPLRNSSA
jgi:hypothetical protein